MAAVLVTGASRGIGEACVGRLARAGHRVFAGVRKAADGERLVSAHGAPVSPVLLDVSDSESVASAARRIGEQLGAAGLDGLVNNAGIVVAGPLEFLPIDEFRRQLEVNVVGVLAVTQAMLPLLRAAHGRIVNISSVSGRTAMPMVGAYAASKFALEAFSDSLRVELRDAGVKVLLVEPGPIATPIWATSMEAADANLARMPQKGLEYYGWMMDAVRRRVGGGKIGEPADDVAQAVEKALFSKTPKARYLVGKNARLRLLFQQVAPTALRDRVIAAALRRM